MILLFEGYLNKLKICERDPKKFIMRTKFLIQLGKTKIKRDIFITGINGTIINLYIDRASLILFK